MVCDYVCTSFNGSPIKPDFVSQHFRLLLKKSDLPLIRFHDLRHSAAAYLKYLGFDLKDIQTWLRHKHIQTTMDIYVTLDMDAKRSIADSLNERFAALSPTFGKKHKKAYKRSKKQLGKRLKPRYN